MSGYPLWVLTHAVAGGWPRLTSAFSQLDVEGALLAVSQDGQLDLIAWLVLAQGGEQVARTPDVGGAEGGNDVTRLYAGAVSRAAWLHLRYERP
jgi:hypothetical protein